MTNLFDYLEWRGELSMEEVSPGEADSLALCLLSYVDMEGIVPPPESGERISLRRAAAEYFLRHGEGGSRPLGLIVPEDILILMRRMAKTARFGSLSLSGYVNEIDGEKTSQFSAVTVHLPDESLFAAIRGTDDTVIGWREDFQLSFLDAIPAQIRAAEYLDRLDLTPETALLVGGHSKGGNLAVWGAVHASERVRERIRTVYSFDGPGFSEGTVTSEAYRSLRDRIRLYLPEDSLVGLLLEHDEDYTVVRSSRRGLHQHDGMTWEVLGSHFLRSDGLSEKGIRADTVLRRRIESLTREERRRLVEVIFTLLEQTGAETLTELCGGGLRGVAEVVKAFRAMDPREREIAVTLWEKLTGKDQRKSPSPPPPPAPKPRRPKGSIRVSFLPWLLP